MRKEQGVSSAGQCVFYIDENGHYAYSTFSTNKEAERITKELSNAGFTVLGIKDVDSACKLCESQIRS